MSGSEVLAGPVKEPGYNCSRSTICTLLKIRRSKDWPWPQESGLDKIEKSLDLLTDQLGDISVNLKRLVDVVTRPMPTKD